MGSTSWLEQFLSTLLPNPQVAAGSARAVSIALWGAASSAVIAYFMFDPTFRECAEFFVFSLPFIGASRVREGWADYKRAKTGEVRPSDVGQ